MAMRIGARAKVLRQVLLSKTSKSKVNVRSSGSQLYATSAQQTSVAPSPSTKWEVRMLYDGECSLCMKEVNFLKSRDEGKDKIVFVDIATPDYDPANNAGITFEQAMERIHAILPDGTIVKDVEVFRILYETVGLGWVYAATKNETFLKVANSVYGVWAKYRTQITGREALEVILERRRLGAKTCADTDESCEIPTGAQQQQAQKSQ